MSIRILLRKCRYCGYRYPYNPITGNFGMICPKCHRVQPKPMPVPSVNEQ